jgi:hypothetical protein
MHMLAVKYFAYNLNNFTLIYLFRFTFIINRVLFLMMTV